MSVAVHGHRGLADRIGRDAHERLVVLTSVLATLLVISLPGILGGLGMVSGISLEDEDVRLSDAAQRVLDEIPGAYPTGGMVVVPAATDPHVVWIGPIADENLTGREVDLGVRGLVPFGTLPTRGEVPPWRTEIEPADRVYSDVGSLHFACAPTPSGGACRGAVLLQHGDRWHPLRADLGNPGAASVTRVSVLGSGGEAGLWLGWAPPGAATAWATIVGHQYIRDVPAQTSDTEAGRHGTMWWLRSSEPVSAVTFKDARGRVVARVTVGD